MLELLFVLNLTQYQVVSEGCIMTSTSDLCGWVPEATYVGSTISGASPIGTSEYSKLITFRRV